MDPFEYANLSQVSYIESLFASYKADPASVDTSWHHFFEGMLFSLKETSSSLGDFYRSYGHLKAQFNPIQTEAVPEFAEKNEPLEAVYCGSVGYEFMHIENEAIRNFITAEVESVKTISPDEKKQALYDLNRSEIFESFIHMKYPGQKRFSLEGAETLIPMLKRVMRSCKNSGVDEIVLGMAHRGRLNVLANILGKSYSMIFREFEGSFMPLSFQGSGDVKYHKGYSSDVDGMHIALAANPSHLESVDPIVEGKTRAKQERKEGKVLPLLIHGDAAIAGQGVVYETMQLSKLEGYSTNGTLHIILNNQIGFTAKPSESRSTRYCSDLAKTFDAPVFHVNAEDPDSCLHIIDLAFAIREKFAIDVFVELNCYRKYGHNEADEPSFTQPKIYSLIKEKQIIRDIYRDQLRSEGIEVKNLETEFKEELAKALAEVKNPLPEVEPPPPEEVCSAIGTGVSNIELLSLAEKLCQLPQDMAVHPKVARLYEDRLKMARGELPVDWGMAESLSFATILSNETPVRLTGQDSIRGTFSHRHAGIYDQKNEKCYIPLANLDNSAPFAIYNSPVSELAVLGFEYGYSLSSPNSFVVWEAQFGDFANGAQVIIDQYITTAEQKWDRRSALTLLLPHGYEGMGPEHSSARMERFLQLAGDNNMAIVNPSTPAQYFHVLRRQAICSSRRPLIVFTPKALLRYSPSLSSIDELTKNRFEEVLVSGEGKRLIFCSGKIYYDLIKQEKSDTTIARIEELYPFPKEQVAKLLENRDRVLWVQEEHSNMGAWEYVRAYLVKLGAMPTYVGRDRSASPATGNVALHKQELENLLKEALS